MKNISKYYRVLQKKVKDCMFSTRDQVPKCPRAQGPKCPKSPRAQGPKSPRPGPKCSRVQLPKSQRSQLRPSCVIVNKTRAKGCFDCAKSCVIAYLWKSVSFKIYIFSCSVWQSHGNNCSHSHTFHQDCICVWQFSLVVKTNRSVRSDHSVNFSLNFCLNFRVME
jgi:hypothetical protein